MDTHTHFYDTARAGGVPWPEKDSPLYRPVFPKDWAAVAEPLGVRETIVVEASKWLEDNEWILQIAAKEKSILGFVGHLLPHEPAFPQQLKRFADNPIFRGIRVSGPDFLDNASRPEFADGIRMLADAGLELDLNGPQDIHEPARKLAEAFPTLRIVIDHVGSAGDPARLNDSWKQSMKALGKQPNVFCKVSALIEQTEESNKAWGHAPRDTEYYKTTIDHCWECFGEDRLIYGSNWPVAEKGGTYADQLRIVKEYFAAKGSEVAEKYFWKNAKAAYRWVERS